METLVNAKTFFAVQIHSYETAGQVAQLVLKTAAASKVQFQRLESMDVLSIGAMDLLRFRSDADNVAPILDALLTQGRAIVRLEGTQYMLRAKSRSGAIPSTRILATPRGTDKQRVYLGTAVSHWSEQFA